MNQFQSLVYIYCLFYVTCDLICFLQFATEHYGFLAMLCSLSCLVLGVFRIGLNPCEEAYHEPMT